MRHITILIIAALLSACQTADTRTERLKPYIGQTMAQFSRGTGLTPAESYDTRGGRTFVVSGPALAVAVAPGVAVQGGCQMLIDTVATNAPGADNWRIVEINAHGPC